MTLFQVPVQVNVPAHGEVEVEADSLENACITVHEEIQVHGLSSFAGEVEFVADWRNVTDLAVADIELPDGRKFSANS